jgi:hypothetical protein
MAALFTFEVMQPLLLLSRKHLREASRNKPFGAVVFDSRGC